MSHRKVIWESRAREKSAKVVLGRVLINAGIGRMSALGANRTRRDGGNDLNDPKRTSSPLMPSYSPAQHRQFISKLWYAERCAAVERARLRGGSQRCRRMVQAGTPRARFWIGQLCSGYYTVGSAIARSSL